MCKFTPCKARVAHRPGDCPSVYGPNCDGIEHYVDDPYAYGMSGKRRLVWLCEGRYLENQYEV